jgi:hypothetical protein
MKHRAFHLLVILSFVLLLLVFIYEYLSLNLWDYDFWWHIASGRYIIENGHIPDKDPFSYTSELEENRNLMPERESFILKQYWLGQIIFFHVYRAFDASGIIVLRALIFLAIILSILWKLKKDEVSFYIIFLSVFLTALTTLSYTAERPVLFTILFSVVVFIILDDFRVRRSKSILLLPPLLLLWANLHGGFILGDVIIGAFIIGESVEHYLLKRTDYTKRDLYIFYASCITAVLLSGLNPNSFKAFYLVFFQKHKIFWQGIEEYVPTLSLYKNRMRPLDIGYVSLLSVFPLVLVFRIRKIGLTHLLLLIGLTIMSLVAFRFVIYFVLVGALILATELHFVIASLFERGFLTRYKDHFRHIALLLVLFYSCFLFASEVNFRMPAFKTSRASVPEQSVDFIEKKHLSGNLYNDFVFGGYVQWRLYPWKKNFVDTRSINFTVLSEARWINSGTRSLKKKDIPEGKTPLWERLLNHYKVNIILLDTLDVHGKLTPLVGVLVDNDKWKPVFADAISIVFLRDTDNNREIIKENRMTNESVYTAILERTERGALRHKNNPNYLISMGDIFYRMGNAKDAIDAYDRAVKRLPEDDPARIQIERLQKEM